MGRPRRYSDEERRERKNARNKQWRANNPDTVKSSDKKLHDRQYAESADEIKRRNSEWQKRNAAWRREYNAKRRAQKRALKD